MKRLAALALILALCISACGTETAGLSPTPEATPLPTATPSPVEEASGGVSPLCTAVLRELRHVRSSEFRSEDDEWQIRETLKYFFLLRRNIDCEREYDIPDFSVFFDETSPDYDNLVYNIDKARYYRLLAEQDDTLDYVWYNCTLTIESLQIDGNTARAQVYDKMDMIYEGMRTMSGAGTTNYVELAKVDGVWLMTDILAADTFDGAVTHEELLEMIDQLSDGEI